MSTTTIFDQPSDFDRDGQLVVYAHRDAMPYLRAAALTDDGNGEVFLTRESAITLMHALDRWLRR